MNIYINVISLSEQMGNYIINELLPIFLSGLVSFVVAYKIMKKTQQGDKELQKKASREQLCEETRMLLCDFKIEAGEAFSSASNAESIRKLPLIDSFRAERNEMLKIQEMNYSEHKLKMEALKDKIMIKTRGVDQFKKLESEFADIVKVYTWLPGGYAIYHEKLEELIMEANKILDLY